MKITSISQTNKHASDDIAGLAQDAVWVLDGATGCYDNVISGYSSDANWYVGVVSAFLERHLGGTAESIETVLKEAVRFAFAAYQRQSGGRPISPDAYPSATVAVARRRGDKIETYLLGDCAIVVSAGCKTQVFRDERGKRFEDPLIEKLQRYQRETGEGILRARRHFAADFQRNRGFKNQPDGYFVMEFDEKAIDCGCHRTFEAGSLRDILLMTDGYYRAVDTFRVYRDADELLRAVRQSGLAEGWRQIDRCEKEDPDCLLYPRTKQFDDSTAVWCGFDAGQ